MDFLSISNLQNIYLFNLQHHPTKSTQPLIIYTRHELPITELIMSPKGTTLVASSEDKASVWINENNHPTCIKGHLDIKKIAPDSCDSDNFITFFNLLNILIIYTGKNLFKIT